MEEKLSKVRGRTKFGEVIDCSISWFWWRLQDSLHLSKPIKLYARKRKFSIYSNLNAGASSLVLLCSTLVLFVSIKTVKTNKQTNSPFECFFQVSKDEEVEGAGLLASDGWDGPGLTQVRERALGSQVHYGCFLAGSEKRGRRLTWGRKPWGEGSLCKSAAPGGGEEQSCAGGKWRAAPTLPSDLRLAHSFQVCRACLSPAPLARGGGWAVLAKIGLPGAGGDGRSQGSVARPPRLGHKGAELVAYQSHRCLPHSTTPYPDQLLQPIAQPKGKAGNRLSWISFMPAVIWPLKGCPPASRISRVGAIGGKEVW